MVTVWASTSQLLFRSAPVSVPRRERLLGLLDLYGIGFALAELAADPQLGTGELVRRLVRASGFPRLRDTLEQTLRWRADAIKAGWALSRLERVAGHTSDRRDREALRIHPDDASARGVSDGDVVRVFNDRGACLAGVMVTDRVRRS